MPVIEFTDNYQDLSTDQGFQFKFRCERCGDGFMSSFQTNALGMAGSLLRGASGLLGGILGQAAAGTFEVQRAVGGTQHDAALRAAIEEVKPLFQKCRRCGNWLCAQTCWNAKADMCKQCAPIAQEEESAMRSEHVRSQVTNDLFLEENRRMSAKAKEAAAKCPDCGAPTLGKKFCPGCGTKLAPAGSFCGECGAKLSPGAKFCGDCGAKQAAE
jgi:Double zinc ribbon